VPSSQPSWRSRVSGRERAQLLGLLHGIAFLGPLDMGSLDDIAGRLTHRAVLAPGVEVITQGDPGDALYIVEEGSAGVLVDGYLISVVETGDGFGERALLRDVPCTATVRANEPMQLFVLSRDDFLASVVGYDNTGVQRVGEAKPRADRFYVLLVGRASILIDGRKVRDLESGDQFGEISLLHGVPRTADVMASSPVVTLSLAGRDLLAGVRARLALG
jgi:CRP/FNR family cyclic AMP-dependent transcriptional regulator